MKLSISLSDEDVAFLDHEIALGHMASRSAGVQEALRELREQRLDAEYDDAWQEWNGSEDQVLWDSTSGDGLVENADRDPRAAG